MIALAATLVLGAGIASAKPADRCGDVAGHYRLQGEGQPLADALAILGVAALAGRGGELRIEGSADNYLRLWVKSDEHGSFPESSQLSLWRNQAYRCEDGWLVFSSQSPQNWRAADDGRHYQGRSRMRLSREGQQLQLIIDFSGREHLSLYSYDSASVQLPKPFSKRTFSDRLSWPVYVEAQVVAEQIREQNSIGQRQLRQTLAGLLAGIRLGALETTGQGTVAAFSASREIEIAAFEDRLSAAGLAYQMVRQPIWSSQHYDFDLLFPTESTRVAAKAAGPQSNGELGKRYPSPFRIQQELEKMRYSLVHVTHVEQQGEGYLATMILFADASSEHVIARVQANSQMFGQMTVISEKPHPEAAQQRIVKMRLQLR